MTYRQVADHVKQSTTMNRWRDTCVTWLCNWLLHHVASASYCKRIDGIVRVGMTTAAYPEHCVDTAVVRSSTTGRVWGIALEDSGTGETVHMIELDPLTGGPLSR